MHDMTSPAILIFDLEIHHDSGELIQIGAYRSANQRIYESPILKNPKARAEALTALAEMAQGAQYLMGHNIMAHDLPYFRKIPIIA